MIATEIPAAITPYSMALAQEAPFTKRKASLSIGLHLTNRNDDTNAAGGVDPDQ
jgi:hypothetical protein